MSEQIVITLEHASSDALEAGKQIVADLQRELQLDDHALWVVSQALASATNAGMLAAAAELVDVLRDHGLSAKLEHSESALAAATRRPRRHTNRKRHRRPR